MFLFGNKKSSQRAAAPRSAPQVNDTIKKLRTAMDTLEKREKHLQKQVDEAHKTAITRSKNKDKRGALAALKRKKLLEKQRDQIYGSKHNMEVQILSLEGATINLESLRAMGEANKSLKALSSDKVQEEAEEVMADIGESVQLQDEVANIMAQEVGPMYDEDELEAELAELEQETLEKELLEVPDIRAPVHQVPEKEPELNLPSVPTGPIVQNQALSSEEARELAELEGMM